MQQRLTPPGAGGEANGLGLLVFGGDGVCRFASDAVIRLWGSHALPGSRVEDMPHEARDCVERLLKTAETAAECELRIHGLVGRAYQFEADGERLYALTLLIGVEGPTPPGPLEAVEAGADSWADPRERARWLDVVLDHAPVGIAIADAPDVRIRRVSRYGLQLLGRPREELEGIVLDSHVDHWRILTARGDREPRPEELPLSRAVKRGELVQSERWCIEACDGRMLTVLCSAAPILDSAGRVAGGIVVWQDITESTRLEQALAESEQRFRTLVEAMPQIVWIARPDGSVEYYNERMADFAGVRSDAFHGTGWRIAVHPEDELRTAQQWQHAVDTGEPYEIEHRIRRHDGVYRWLLSRGYPLRNAEGRVIQWFGTATDIHDQKQAEQALRRVKQQLEQRVMERTAALERRAHELRGLARELAEAERRERERIAKMLHDGLQQTLVAAKMRAQVVQNAVDQRHREQFHELVALLEGGIEQSRSLTVQLSPPYLHERGIVAALHWLAKRMQQEHNLTVTIEGDDQHYDIDEAVRDFLFQAVRELLFNVVKHAETDRATVTVTQKRNTIQIEVGDEGSGFEAKELRSASDEATGLGLAGLQQRLKVLGGGFAVRSSPGAGCRVTLTVPANG